MQLKNESLSRRGSIKTASKRSIQNTAEVTGDLMGNEIADKTTRSSKTSLKIIQKRIKKKYLKNICHKYIPQELRQKIIDDLRLKLEHF